MRPLKLRLSGDGFTRLHAAADRARRGSKVAKVPLDELRALLLDHAAALNVARECGAQLEEPR